MAVLAGMVGFGALLSYAALLGRLVAIPPSQPIVTPPEMPPITAFVLLVMGSLVAGVTEEAGFRGYMQGPIERRFGRALGIVVPGVVFGLLHFPNHPSHVVGMLPYYVAVSAVYGGITAACNSILPALALHAGGDVWSLTRLWMTGVAEWQLAAQPRPLVWDTGVDAAFLIAAAFLLGFAAICAWLCALTARLRQAATGPEPAPGHATVG